MWEDHPDFKAIRNRILKRYFIRLAPFLHLFIWAIAASMFPAWRYPHFTGFINLWFGIVILHFIGVVFWGFVNRAARREFEREHGKGAATDKPKRDPIARLSADGEIVDDEQEWEPSRNHRRA